MTLYGQRGEDEYILRHFEGQTGQFLDIGAFHPETFSNVKALYDKGWKGTLIEPANSNYPFIRDYYAEDKEMEVIQTCIGTFDGEITFYDSNGDAVSSTDLDHKLKWEQGYGSTFTEYKSPIITFDTLLTKTKYQEYQFINIDVEGTNWEILQTIDPYKVGCRMICIEFDDKKAEITAYLTERGFFRYHETAENLIFVL